MAHATPTTATPHLGASIHTALHTFFAGISDRRRRNAAYRKTARELDQMTDRDLADIGITRFMIADVAAEAARRA